MHYIEDPAGHIQIHWEPPTLVSDELGSQNVNIDSRITNFMIYVTTKESTIVSNASGTFFDSANNNISCSLSFQVAAVNPAGVGEHSPLQNLTVGCEFAGYDILKFLHIMGKFHTSVTNKRYTPQPIIYIQSVWIPQV